MTNFSIELGTTKLFSTGVCNIDLAVLIYARSIQKWGSCCIEECNVQCPIFTGFPMDIPFRSADSETKASPV